MKILHIIPSISPLRGGPSQAVLAMVWALRQQGVEAEIATTNDDGDHQLDVPLNRLVNYPIDVQDPHQTVPVRFFPRFSPKINAVREFSISSDLTAWLWQNIAKYDCLHIHAIFSYASTMAMSIARSRHIPYVIRPLGQLCHWSLQQSQRKKHYYLQLIERENLQQAQAIHFTALQEQQEAATLGLDTPSFILPHGLNMPQLITHPKTQLQQWLGLPTNQPILLFFSRLHPKKGIEALINALGNLTEQPFQLVIAGQGEAAYEQQIRQQLAVNGLNDRSHLVGFVTGDRKQILLQGADLFALPSHSENFGIAVLEAMAAGLPSLITPNVGLAPIIAQHDLGWVVDQDPTAIAGALSHFFQQPEYAKAMGHRAIAIVKSQFTWAQVAQQLIHQYNPAAATHHQSSSQPC
jgi:glycosyltransferase involved in cell wall biosynthesis